MMAFMGDEVGKRVDPFKNAFLEFNFMIEVGEPEGIKATKAMLERVREELVPDYS